MYDAIIKPSHKISVGLSDNQKSPNWQYSTISEIFYNADLGHYNTYGIKVLEAENIEEIHDISTSKETVEKIVELFNRCQLSPIHFQDILEDLLR